MKSRKVNELTVLAFSYILVTLNNGLPGVNSFGNIFDVTFDMHQHTQ